MLISPQNYSEVIDSLLKEEWIAIDTETTGLRPFHGDEPFAIVVATATSEYYFNLNYYPGVEPLFNVAIEKLRQVFLSTYIHKVFHNAQFDLHQLKTIGLDVAGPIYDLWFLARLEDNTHFSYKLDDIAKRRGLEKLDVAYDYVKKHKLTEKFEDKELSKQWDSLHYELVPLEIMQTYAEMDARLTFDIAKEILEKIRLSDASQASNIPKQMQVVQNESRLVETVFRMEQAGIKIDRAYCLEAQNYYKDLISGSEAKFKELTGEDFVKGEIVFKKVFVDEKWQFTEKGNPQFNADALSRFKHPAARVVLDYSEAKKQLEYFQNFLFYADANDIVHASFLQAGATTGRFSSRAPNLQNLTNPDKYDDEAESSRYPVRKSFVPRDGYFFVMIDFKQIEFRVMLDRAKATTLIKKINQTGLDVHQVTADVANVTRKQAKTVNFLTVYGGGNKKLAEDLGCSTIQAKKIQGSIFSAAPEIPTLIRNVIGVAETRGFIFNWLGRRYKFPRREFCYVAPNHLIQGESADILKLAMNIIDLYLHNYASRMLLPIHDELVFEIKHGEEFVIDEIVRIMTSVYPFKSLPLLVDVEYSMHNLADKEAWPPPSFTNVKASGNAVQRESSFEA